MKDPSLGKYSTARLDLDVDVRTTFKPRSRSLLN
jgi:hypothetical protein